MSPTEIYPCSRILLMNDHSMSCIPCPSCRPDCQCQDIHWHIPAQYLTIYSVCTAVPRYRGGMFRPRRWNNKSAKRRQMSWSDYCESRVLYKCPRQVRPAYVQPTVPETPGYILDYSNRFRRDRVLTLVATVDPKIIIFKQSIIYPQLPKNWKILNTLKAKI